MVIDLKSEIPASFIFSQSSLQDYVDCPRRFQLRYIEQLSWPAVETEPFLEYERRQHEGQIFHRLIQQHLIGLPVQSLNKLANTPDMKRWWENYLGTYFDLGDFTKYTEITLSTTSGSHRLLAKYDLIAVTLDRKFIIFDWKTYHKRPRNEWMAARIQTRVYRALLASAGTFLNNGAMIQPNQIEMIYWYAEFPAEPTHLPYDAPTYQRDWEALQGIIREISNHRFFPMTDDEKKCSFCPYRSFCSRGTQAGKIEEGEAEMESAAAADFNLNFEQISEVEF